MERISAPKQIWARSAAVDRVLPSLVLAGALSGAVLSKAFVAGGFSWGHFLYSAAAALAAVRIWATHEPMTIPPWAMTMVALAAWASVGSLGASLVVPFDFSMAEFLKSLMHLFLVMSSSYLLWSFCRTLPEHLRHEVVLAFSLTTALVAVYLYLALLTGWLPGPRSWIDPNATENYYLGTSTLFRARGFFGEPSELGLFQVLCAAYILCDPRPLTSRRGACLALILLSVILTFSISAYALALMLLPLSAGRRAFGRTPLNTSRRRPTSRKALYLLLAIMSSLLIISLSVGPNPLSALSGRLARIAQGHDNSANLRLTASWEPTFAVTASSPFFGAGLGNLAAATEHFRADLPHGRLLDESAPEGWNMLSWVLGSMGFLGLLIWIALFGQLLGRHATLGVLLLLLMFASGAALEPLLWLFFTLFMLCASPRRILSFSSRSDFLVQKESE
jgi:hypothetical protein